MSVWDKVRDKVVKELDVGIRTGGFVDDANVRIQGEVFVGRNSGNPPMSLINWQACMPTKRIRNHARQELGTRRT